MSSAPTQLGALPAAAITNIKGELITTAIQFFLHGLYTTLVSIALYNIRSHKATLPAQRALSIATLIMFAFSNLQVIEQLAFNVVQLGSLGLHPPDKSTLLLNIRLSENVFGRANYFMSDAIVVWRAWVLWQDSLGVKVLLSLCLCGTFVGLTVNMTFGTLWLYGNERFNPSGPRSLILVLPLMFTNIVSTTLIGIRAWSYRKHIKQVLSLPRNRKTNVERILIILTESGAIYCLFWIPFLYICLTTDVDSIGYKIVANMLPQLSAIYPVIIVLLVTMEKTQLEATMSSAVTETLHFVTRPAVAGTNMNLSAAGEDCFGNPRSQSSGTAGDRDDDDEDSKEKEMGKGKGEHEGREYRVSCAS